MNILHGRCLAYRPSSNNTQKMHEMAWTMASLGTNTCKMTNFQARGPGMLDTNPNLGMGVVYVGEDGYD